MDDAFVAGKFFYSLCGSVSAAVIHHDQVIGEGGLLFQNTANGIADGAFTVTDGDDDRCLDGELAFREIYILESFRSHISTNGFKMGGASLLHLYLPIAVAWVHIVELLLAAQSGILFDLGIKEFVGMNRQHGAADEEAEIIQGGKAIVYFLGLGNIILQCRSTNQEQ